MIKLLIGLTCCITLFILLVLSTQDYETFRTKIYGPKSSEKLHFINDNKITCYEETTHINGLEELNLIEENDVLQSSGNIFFLETSCFEEDGLFLNARQACAVESAARMHPNMTVHLLFLSPLKISDSSKEIFNQLLTYKNIKIRRIYINDYMRHTPLEEWYASGILRTSRWPRSHISDILRYLTLWKYPGIYLDLDVVIQKPLDDLNNFVGAEDFGNIAAGVIGFGGGKFGRDVANACIENLKNNFRGDIWGNNGPGVITRVLKKLCNTESIYYMTLSGCNKFKVYPPSAFYPIHYKNWTKYFELDDKNETMELIENSKAIHVWNNLSKQKKIQVGTKVPYAIIAEKYCPRVYNNCGTIF